MELNNYSDLPKKINFKYIGYYIMHDNKFIKIESLVNKHNLEKELQLFETESNVK